MYTTNNIIKPYEEEGHTTVFIKFYRFDEINTELEHLKKPYRIERTPEWKKKIKNKNRRISVNIIPLDDYNKEKL